jgi:hypothetical protein
LLIQTWMSVPHDFCVSVTSALAPVAWLMADQVTACAAGGSCRNAL